MNKKLLKKLSLIILSAMILSSCTCPTQTAGRIERPASPIYPTIFGHKLQCLDVETYKLLSVRRAMCEGRVKTLENSIDEFNKKQTE